MEVWNGAWTPDDEVSRAGRTPAQGSGCGAVTPQRRSSVRPSVTGAEGCDVRLVTDQGLVFTAPGAASLEWRTTPARAAYVRAEVRHPAQVPPLPGAPAAFTNPIWLDS
ncbi:hypothetical protein [Streptomyces sp. NPDC002082]|uniref:hypothetical protein n=1 Tax=Streptomyces sp. NPDC002082 TaxID=3154772 RepID=UPI00332C919E